MGGWVDGTLLMQSGLLTLLDVDDVVDRRQFVFKEQLLVGFIKHTERPEPDAFCYPFPF